MKIGILASGNLGLSTIEILSKSFVPLFVATDSHSYGIINWATENKVPLFKGNPRNGKLASFLSNNVYDIIFSINYLFIIEKDVFEKAKFPINFHGSLLPKYRGRTPHVWSIINNEKETGITAHLINDGCDTGAVILQKTININPDDTGAMILSQYTKIYPQMVCEILDQIILHKLNAIEQDHTKASYFGKRTPEDGIIVWDWHKERINNWVRAQAHPYPGAFTFFNDIKIIIDQIKFSDFGFKDTDPNGLVLETNPKPIVKTPNGAIELSIIRSNQDIIVKGQILA